jgi:hypothetical protein
MRRIAALLMLATAVACGGSDATAPPNQTQVATFTGTYVLQTVNGKPLPVTWNFNSGDYLTIRSYSIAINGSGGWSSSTNEIFTTGGVVTDQPNGGQTGSYTYNAATKAVTLISQDQSTLLSGSVSADLSTLTVSESTDIFVFKK